MKFLLVFSLLLGQGFNINDKPVKLTFRNSYLQKPFSDGKTIQQVMTDKARDGVRSYDLMAIGRNIGALVTMFELTDSIHYVEEVLRLTDGFISQTKPGKDIPQNPEVFKDDYLGWVNGAQRSNGRGGADFQEIPLFESRFMRYIAKVVYLVSKQKQIEQDYPELWELNKRILRFVETHIWEKWYVRGERQSPGCYRYVFRSRTHMTSHWGIIALYLRELTDDPVKQAQYNAFLARYNKQLRANLHVTKDNAYRWNMTWDNPWPWGLDCKAADEPIIQDVGHGNHVAAYIIESYELENGEVWTSTDVQQFCNTVKYLLYDKKQVRFNAYLDGRFEIEFADGIRMFDGFLSLSRYDPSLLDIFKKVFAAQYTDNNFRFNEPQYVAELWMAEKYNNER